MAVAAAVDIKKGAASLQRVLHLRRCHAIWTHFTEVVIFLDSSQNFDFDEPGFDYADAVRALRFSALSADSTMPSLAFAHVS
jgi:hypothetical protein